MSLPLSIDPWTFHTEFRTTPSAWIDVIGQVCRRCGIVAQDLVPCMEGSNLVAAVGRDYLVKVFPPFHRHQFESESRVLPFCAKRLPIQVPEFVAEGTLDGGWTYVVMTQLSGVLLETVWPTLAADEREEILRALGEGMAAAHALDIAPLAGLPPDWDTFLQGQVAGCRARHERHGVPSWLLSSLDGWIGARSPFLASSGTGSGTGSGTNRGVMLTGEYTPFNLLVDLSGAAPRLSGMFDFGDAMIGPPDYDFLGPAAFLVAGNPTLFSALLDGYGLPASERTRALRERWMVLLLLHRYSHLRVQVRLEGWEQLGSLDRLAERLFPIG